MKKTLMAIVPALLLALPAYSLEVGDEAPCVVLDGVDASGQDVRGCIRDQVEPSTQSFTFIEFFSILCSTCQKNLPIVSQLAEDIKSKATVRLVSVDPNESDVRAFLANNPAKSLVKFPVAFDTDRDAKRAYDVIKTPTAFLLDKNNEVLFKHSGGVLTDANITEIKKLVGISSNSGGGTGGGGCGGSHN